MPGPDAPETDRLGAPYTVETIHLDEDHEGEVVATLVRRPADEGADTGRAVLHIHGFADYFFHTEWAAWWTARGYTFYALDLRKYGRSLLPHQTANYVGDLHEHFEELDASWQRITERDGFSEVVLTAHSTGGLIAALWANERQLDLLATVLNSPWLDLAGPWALRAFGTPLVRRVAAVRPFLAIPRSVSGLYVESLHRDFGGEWDFELELKPVLSWPVFAGWVRAIRDGHAEVHRGLAIRGPILVLSSDRTTFPATMTDDVHATDIVLDVRQIRRWAPSLGGHVTTVAIPGAKHDVILSRPGPRAAAYAELDHWLSAYV